MPSEIVSPTIAFLAHESCPFTGKCIESIGGHVSRFYLARTPGFADTRMTIETIAEPVAAPTWPAEPELLDSNGQV
jgi:hypothetical protein